MFFRNSSRSFNDTDSDSNSQYQLRNSSIFWSRRMAHFMLPGFIRIVDELPKTPTRKVQKNLLKEAGITPDTRDCEVAGITVKREEISV